jgi:hypothetical protein
MKRRCSRCDTRSGGVADAALEDQGEMSTSANPGQALPASTEERLPNVIFGVVKGVIGIFGVSGVLYGAGFLALRSHFASLDVWSAVPSNSSDIAEQGALFFRDLILLQADTIASLFHSTKVAFPVAFVVLALAGLLWDRRGWLHRFRKNPPLGQIGLGSRLYSQSPAFLLIVSLAFTYILRRRQA